MSVMSVILNLHPTRARFYGFVAKGGHCVYLRWERECPTGSRKSAAMVNTSYPTFCISAMLSSSRSRCAFSIQRCS